MGSGIEISGVIAATPIEQIGGTGSEGAGISVGRGSDLFPSTRLAG